MRTVVVERLLSPDRVCAMRKINDSHSDQGILGSWTSWPSPARSACRSLSASALASPSAVYRCPRTLSPWGLILFSLIGAVSGFWTLYKKLCPMNGMNPAGIVRHRGRSAEGGVYGSFYTYVKATICKLIGFTCRHRCPVGRVVAVHKWLVYRQRLEHRVFLHAAVRYGP